MRKVLNHRIISVLLVVVLSFTAIVPVSAVGFDLTPDTASVNLWSTSIKSPATAVVQTIAGAFGIPADFNGVFWFLMNNAVGITGPHTLDYMNDLVGRYHQAFNGEYYEGFWGTALKNSQALGRQTFASCFFAQGVLDFELASAPSGLLRIREKHSGRWVVNSAGEYPYCEGGKLAPTCGGNKWIGERSCSTAKTNMKNLDTINLLCNKIKESGTPAQIKPLGTNYKAIWWNRQYYCDPEGRPFVCYASEGQAAINQPRPDTSVKDEDGKPAEDESGTVINNPDNSTNIDLSGMTITLPNGNVQVADAVIYDESTKTYYIDSHDTTNYNITYNYSWTYHINYTSITYIGQTEQYDKYYKVYYELPDGRDSADLTAEELEQLDFNIDVVNYGRSADDTSLRALYHLDGDTHDCSYWNYCTDFSWLAGASLTYMDAGVFNGALYLDETSHKFKVKLPSSIYNEDFCLQFRYYQSHTQAPQTDSDITINGDTNIVLVKMNGANFFNGAGSSITSTPIGQWNEICIERSNGYIHFYLNGVMCNQSYNNVCLYDTITFNFGSSQQTYKYIDEIRFINKALHNISNYECSTVPYDTNLSLVLPDSVRPVADEYWSFDKTITPLYSFDYSSAEGFVPVSWSNANGGTGTIQHTANFVKLTSTSSAWFLTGCSSIPIEKNVCFSIVDSGGNIYSVTTHGWGGGAQYYSDVYSWGRLHAIQNGSFWQFNIEINTGQSLNLIYAECVMGETPNTGHKYITSITPVTSYTKPTLAVRTDIPITSKQIGGARPSVPTKGLVWAMVESGVIKSIQIYNGSAWEACDGRIFIGKRWVPYGSYNIITLKDFYDVADASGDSYEYIYSETGFWNWWQKSWNAFTNKLFAALGSAGFDVSGGTSPDGTSKSLWDRIKNAFNDTLGALIETLFTLIEDVLKALLSLVTDMLSFFFGFLTDTVLGAVKAFFAAFKDNSLFDFFQQPPVIGSDGKETDGGYGLPGEVSTAFAFISGVIMVLPPDIRSILFFGLGIMMLLGVFKLVKA